MSYFNLTFIYVIILFDIFRYKMSTVIKTKLSSKGQMIIPKNLREKKKWQAGQTFTVTETKEGLLLKPDFGFPKTKFENVAGCLAYSGKAKSVQEMDEGIANAIRKSFS